ncbi:MAG TPA: DUF309 domain-containing protein [Isosphaeraceae bacterium]|nr:DUF309 domain-containing protein [Isosphaeraceae bacterium]
MSQDDALPTYSFVPGGPWPHPHRGKPPSRPGEGVAPVVGDDWRASADYTHGIRLFNAGYYWEAHEAWEGLWHAHGRHGPTADVLKGLIKLAASGVKVRERQAWGVASHARRAADLFEAVQAGGAPIMLGLDLEVMAAIARRVAANPPVDDSPEGAVVVRVFDFEIDPS